MKNSSNIVQWQNLPKYSFNAKELDEETGMYYYEARYYKPPVFTSRDPMFEKYFWMTPYAYCANNPVKYVDPTGLTWYQVGENGEITPMKDKNGKKLGANDKFDMLYGKKGKDPIKVEDQSILSELSKIKEEIPRFDAEGTEIQKGYLRYTTSENKQEMTKVFVFTAQNSNVEWAIYSHSEKGKIGYSLGTQGFDDEAPSPSMFGINAKNVTSMIHSHTGLTNIKSEKDSMWGDQRVARKVSYNYYMYAPNSGNLYQIGNQNGNIIEKGKMNSYKVLMQFLK